MKNGHTAQDTTNTPKQRRLSELEAALNAHPSVVEAAVLRRRDMEGRQRLVAYFVPMGSFSPDTLRAHLRQTLPGQPLPDAYVPVSALPLGESGEVDQPWLSGLAVIDDRLVEEWKQVLSRAEGVDQVEVIVQERTQRIPHVHLSDLLPEERPKHKVRVAEGDSPIFPAGKSGQSPSLPQVLDGDSPIFAARKSGQSPASPGQSPASQPAAEDAAGRSGSVPSLSDGGPLEMPPGGPRTLADALRRAAAARPEHGIVYIEPDGTATEQAYPELLKEAGRVLGGLRKRGLAAGDKVIFQLDANQDFLAAFWGCILGGMIPVPISPAPAYEPASAAVQKLYNAWRMLDRPLILAGSSLAPAIWSVLDDLGVKDARLQTLDQLRGAEPAGDWHAGEPDDLTLLLLTSGSTGMPKAVMHSHRTLLSRSAGVVRFNHFTCDDVSLNWMPLDHVGGIVMFHLRDVFACSGQVQVPTELILQEPLQWLDLIDRHRATATWAPNFAFGLVNDRSAEVAHRRWDLSCLRFILNGGEAIVPKTARRFLEILAPHGLAGTSMNPAWGMSETSSGVTYSHRFTLQTTRDEDRYVEVGRPIPGISLRIVDKRNRVVPEGTPGHLQIRGATVTPGYYRNPEVNREAFTGDGWFVTGDVGVLRDGALTITGRAKDEIIINGVNYVGAEIEAVVETVEGVETSYAAACAVRAPESNTDDLAIFFSPSRFDEDGLPRLLDAIRVKVGAGVGIVPSYLVPLEKDQIPKTAIGKIQRSRLKKRFEDGHFDATLKRIDVLAENANTIPDWFFRKVWHRKEPQVQVQARRPGHWLVFADPAGLGASVGERLRGAGQSCAVVEPGKTFARLGPHRYRIDPEDPDHYRQLVTSLTKSGHAVDQVLHFWTYRESAEDIGSIDALRQAQYQGLFSLLFLVQALVKVQGDGRPVRLHVFGSHTQMTSPEDTCTCEHSTVVGLLKTIPLEMPWLSCRHTDLEVDEVKANTRRVLREVQIIQSEDEVAYRGGRRLVWGLSRVDLRRRGPGDVPIKRGGIYLVTGGLGGIGSSLAQLLMKRYQAKLILLGTTPLPERSRWPACLDRGGQLAERLRNYQKIESAGDDFLYHPVDVSDLPALERVVAAAESRWNGRLAGVFHLASAGDPALHWKQMDQYRVSTETVEVFDSMFRSKVYGSWAVFQLVKDRPGAIVVSFSSTTGLFGGATFSAYGAAQTFLSCHALHKRYRGHPNSYCFVWGVWDGIGMSKGDPSYVRDLYRTAGYCMVPEKHGFDSLLAALGRDQHELIVGLDAGNRNIQRHLHADPHPLQELVAYYTTRGASPSARDLGEPGLKDRFGTTSRCAFRRLADLPLTDDGHVDREALLLTESAGRATVRPRNEIEHRIAAIWREVLGVGQVGVHEGFFQLGGNSLRATQVLSRVRQAFQLNLTLRDFFQHATVAQLAALVKRRPAGPPAEKDGETIERTDPQSLLEEVDNLSDEQVAALLARMRQREDNR